MLGIAPGPELKTRRDLAPLSSWRLRVKRAPLPSARPLGASAPCLSVPSANGQSVCARRAGIQAVQELRPSEDPCQAGTWLGEEGSHLRLVKEERKVLAGSCAGEERGRGLLCAPLWRGCKPRSTWPRLLLALVPGEASACCQPWNADAAGAGPVSCRGCAALVPPPRAL